MRRGYNCPESTFQRVFATQIKEVKNGFPYRSLAVAHKIVDAFKLVPKLGECPQDPQKCPLYEHCRGQTVEKFNETMRLAEDTRRAVTIDQLAQIYKSVPPQRFSPDQPVPSDHSSREAQERAFTFEFNDAMESITGIVLNPQQEASPQVLDEIRRSIGEIE